MATDVSSTIKVNPNRGVVEAVIISGFAQITTFGLEYQPANGAARTIVSLYEGKIGRMYPVGSPKQIIGNGGLLCWGRIFKTAGDSYHVVCSFSQDGAHMAESAAVSGKFQGEHVDFSIQCAFVS